MITEETNLDYLIPALQLHFGDLDGTQYSDAVYRTALVSGVNYLSKRWNNKYYIDDTNNAQRSDSIVFVDPSPPIIERADQYTIVLAATVILRGMALSSSSTSFSSWSTPDLTVSSGSQERTLTKLYENAVSDLDNVFKTSLGTSRKRFMYDHYGRYPVTE